MYFTIAVLSSQRDSLTTQWIKLNISAQCGFCLIKSFHHCSGREYSRNNIFRNYIHRCREETLRALHQHLAAPNTTLLLDALIDTTCADDGAIPGSSHKLPPTKCLWAWIQLGWGVYTVNDFKWGVSHSTSWQFSSRSLHITIFTMIVCYNENIEYSAFTSNS